MAYCTVPYAFCRANVVLSSLAWHKMFIYSLIIQYSHCMDDFSKINIFTQYYYWNSKWIRCISVAQIQSSWIYNPFKRQQCISIHRNTFEWINLSSLICAKSCPQVLFNGCLIEILYSAQLYNIFLHILWQLHTQCVYKCVENIKK